MRRLAIALLITCIVGLIILLYSSLNDTSLQQDPGKVPQKISLYHYFSGALSGGINEMIDTVNARQEDKQVNASALDHEAFKSMIHSTLEEGSPPELFTYWAGARTESLIQRNQLAAIGDIWPMEEWNQRFPQSIVEAAVSYGGKKFLMPITQHVVVIFYNRLIFDQEGLVPPKTWPEFIAICNQLRKRGLNPLALGAKERWPAQFWFDYILLRTAGPAYRSKLMHGEASYTDKEVLRTYQIWSDLLLDSFFNSSANDIDWDEAVELVCNKEAAMTLMGTWAIQHFTGENCAMEAEQQFDYFPFPMIDDGVETTSVGPIDGIVLTKNSSYHDFAKEVLTFFAEKDPQQRMSKGSGALAPSVEVPKEFYDPFKQRLLLEIKNSKKWAFNYDLATTPDVAEKGMDSFVELIAYPDQYMEILENLEMERQLISGNK